MQKILIELSVKERNFITSVLSSLMDENTDISYLHTCDVFNYSDKDVNKIIDSLLNNNYKYPMQVDDDISINDDIKKKAEIEALKYWKPDKPGYSKWGHISTIKAYISGYILGCNYFVK